MSIGNKNLNDYFLQSYIIMSQDPSNDQKISPHVTHLVSDPLYEIRRS